MAAVTDEPGLQTIGGIRVEMQTRGNGRPVLFLHPENGFDFAAPALDALAAKTRVVAPSHPAFGRSEVAPWMSTVDDLAYFYLDLLDELDLRNVALVGVSFGAWLAAAIAIKSTARFSHVVLTSALGIKVGDRETRDIPDIFAMTDAQYLETVYADPAVAKRDYTAMAEADLKVIARNREATARYGWSPYMHDPKLKRRLHRIRVPTLVLWGENDRMTTPDYGRALAAAVPGARFETIARAGHFPHAEQPTAFAQKTLAFLGLA